MLQRSTTFWILRGKITVGMCLFFSSFKFLFYFILFTHFWILRVLLEKKKNIICALGSAICFMNRYDFKSDAIDVKYPIRICKNDSLFPRKVQPFPLLQYLSGIIMDYPDWLWSIIRTESSSALMDCSNEI